MKELNAQTPSLLKLIKDQDAYVGVVGLGYVGLPLAVLAVETGYRVIGLDIDEGKIDRLRNGTTSIESVTRDRLHGVLESCKLTLTSCYESLSDCDMVVVCVPTGLDGDRQSDLPNVEGAATVLGEVVKGGIGVENARQLQIFTKPGGAVNPIPAGWAALELLEGSVQPSLLTAQVDPIPTGQTGHL